MKIKLPFFQFNNPIPLEKLNEVLRLIDFEQVSSILDIGGGNGEVLLQALSKGNSHGILLDIDKGLLESCKRKNSQLVENGRLLIEEKDAAEFLKGLEANSLDCIICMGSSHALGGYLALVNSTKPYLKPNGILLLGEGFWNEQPNEEYLGFLESDESEMMYHFQNIEEVEKLGFTYLYSNVASEDDWNQWEGIYFLQEELKFSANPNHENLKKLNELRDFRKMQIQYGRRMMGFGLYLFSKATK